MTLAEPRKDGLVHKTLSWNLIVQTNLPGFQQQSFQIRRKFTDFLWIQDFLTVRDRTTAKILSLILRGYDARCHRLRSSLVSGGEVFWSPLHRYALEDSVTGLSKA